MSGRRVNPPNGVLEPGNRHGESSLRGPESCASSSRVASAPTSRLQPGMTQGFMHSAAPARCNTLSIDHGDLPCGSRRRAERGRCSISWRRGKELLTRLIPHIGLPGQSARADQRSECCSKGPRPPAPKTNQYNEGNHFLVEPGIAKVGWDPLMIEAKLNILQPCYPREGKKKGKYTAQGAGSAESERKVAHDRGTYCDVKS